MFLSLRPPLAPLPPSPSINLPRRPHFLAEESPFEHGNRPNGDRQGIQFPEWYALTIADWTIPAFEGGFFCEEVGVVGAGLLRVMEGGGRHSAVGGSLSAMVDGRDVRFVL